jgi:hypothetical protein
MAPLWKTTLQIQGRLREIGVRREQKRIQRNVELKFDVDFYIDVSVVVIFDGDYVVLLR